VRDYRKIKAWIAADDLVVAVYALSRTHPADEKYGITAQLRRAAVSVPTNIAEGSARDSVREWLHFLHIARGSLTETQYLLHLAGRLNLGSDDSRQTALGLARQTFRLLHGLIRSVERESRG
jgi:four helix bundle protein